MHRPVLRIDRDALVAREHQIDLDAATTEVTKQFALVGFSAGRRVRVHAAVRRADPHRVATISTYGDTPVAR